MVTLLVLVALGVVTLLAVGPPPAVSSDAPASQFSSARAAEHLDEISRRPHPTGSGDIGRVRRYIADTARAAGAEVEVQTAEVARAGEDGPIPAASVQNVVARVPGSQPELSGGQAVLVVSHYDSVPTGPGAADDGAAVAAMLEALRALQASTGMRNDVVFLFTDAEELGLLGAAAFVAGNDLSRFGVVLNWEARGSRGPAWMFQTGDGNHPLVRAFVAASPRPVANSLTDEVYQRLPNDTDFTVFLDAGATGLNSAFIEGLHDYHAPTDTPQRLDARSMQHHGATMLGLVHELGDVDLRTLRGGDAVYFDVLGRFVVHYPVSWAVPLALAAVLALVALVVVGWRRSALRPGRTLAVAGVALAAVPVAGLVAIGLWRLVLLLRPGLLALPLAQPYEEATFVAGFSLVAVAALLAAAGLLRRRTFGELLAGALVVLGVLALLCAFTVPGASYLWLWPLVAGLPALGVAAVRRPDAVPGRRGAVLAGLAGLAGAVAVVLFVPLVDNLFVALGITLAAVAVAFAVLGGLVLLPLLAALLRQPLDRAAGLAPAAIGLLAAVAVLGVAVADSGFTATERRPDALVYVHDAAEDRSVWLTGDPAPDEWTSKALGEMPATTPATGYLPEFGDAPLLTAPAPAVELAPPVVELLSEAVSGEVRTVRFRVESARDAWKLRVRLPVESLRSCTVAGQTFDAERLREGADETGGAVFDGYGFTAGLEMSCAVDAGAPLAVEVFDFTAELPDEIAALVGPRPDTVQSVSYGLGPTDSAVVRQTTTL